MANWKQPELRGILARVVDHGPMKQAVDKKVAELNGHFKDGPAEGNDRTIACHLYPVAETFAQIKYNCKEADYKLARTWDRTEVLLHINGIAEAFKSVSSLNVNDQRTSAERKNGSQQEAVAHGWCKVLTRLVLH